MAEESAPGGWTGAGSGFSFLPLILWAACTTITPVLNSGVAGQVLIGPVCPVLQEGLECPDRPYQAELEVTDLQGRLIERARSDEKGHFRIPLSPGEYILVPISPNGSGPPSAQPVPFRVGPDDWTKLTVSFDSGIR